MSETITEQTLERYVDGELDERQAHRVEERLAADPALQDKVDQLSRLNGLFAQMGDTQIEEVSFDGFATRVQHMIREDARPVSLSERMGAAVSEFLTYQKRVWVPAFSVVAAAAGLLLVVTLGDGDRAGVSMPRGADATTWQAGVRPEGVSSVTISDAGHWQHTEYQLETDAGQRVGVIWIEE